MNQKDRVFPVVFISDKEYLMPTYIAIYSLIKANSGDNYDIHLILSDCTDNDERFFDSLDYHISFIHSSTDDYKDIKQLGHITRSV